MSDIQDARRWRTLVRSALLVVLREPKGTITLTRADNNVPMTDGLTTAMDALARTHAHRDGNTPLLMLCCRRDVTECTCGRKTPVQETLLQRNVWTPITRMQPASADADSNGDVEYLRSGKWECLGKPDKIPVDATHWRPTGRDDTNTPPTEVPMPESTALSLTQLLNDLEDALTHEDRNTARSKVNAAMQKALAEAAVISREEFMAACERADAEQKKTNGHTYLRMLKTRCQACGRSPKQKGVCPGWVEHFLNLLYRELFEPRKIT